MIGAGFKPAPSSLNIYPVQIASARAGGSAGFEELIEPGEIVLGQFDIDGLQVFLQVTAAFVAWDRDDVLTLGHQPSQRQLRRRR